MPRDHHGVGERLVVRLVEAEEVLVVGVPGGDVRAGAVVEELEEEGVVLWGDFPGI